jgi:hypothetical protein
MGSQLHATISLIIGEIRLSLTGKPIQQNMILYNSQ